jgi:thioredoxin 1
VLRFIVGGIPVTIRGKRMQNVFEVDDSSFDKEVLSAPVPVLVDFSATWCGPCKKLEPIVGELAIQYDGRVKVVKVDVDRAPQAAARFGVLSVPSLLLFHRGEVKDQVVGLVPKRTIEDRLSKVL